MLGVVRHVQACPECSEIRNCWYFQKVFPTIMVYYWLFLFSWTSMHATIWSNSNNGPTEKILKGNKFFFKNFMVARDVQFFVKEIIKHWMKQRSLWKRCIMGIHPCFVFSVLGFCKIEQNTEKKWIKIYVE